MQSTDDEFWNFEPDVAQRLLRITLRGFWTIEVLDRYEAVLAQQMKANKLLGGETFLLVDARGLEVQSPTVVDRLQAHLARLSPYHPTRCALIVPGALAKMQGTRIGSPLPQKVFDEEAAALAWLFPA